MDRRDYLIFTVFCALLSLTSRPTLACLGGGGNDEENRVDSEARPAETQPMIAEPKASQDRDFPEPSHAVVDDKKDEDGGASDAKKPSAESETTEETSRADVTETTKAMEGTSSTSESGTEITTSKDEDLTLSPRFVQTYLREFGYLTDKSVNIDVDNMPNDSEFRSALLRFQEFVNIRPASGKMDMPTTEQMLRKRCANSDVTRQEKVPKVWERSTLKWHLTSPNGTASAEWLPKSIELKDLRELIREAFSAWEIVISMEFIEEAVDANAADIVFVVGDDNNQLEGNKSGLGIASGSPPEKSRIWLHRNESWATFQVQEENKIDIFLVLIHEIGHALGLEHSRDPNSVMFPLLERDVGAQLPVISNDDVERLRMLYDPDEEVNANDDIGSSLDNTFSGNGTSAGPSRKCPNALWAAAQAWPRGDIFIFLDVNVWRFDKNRQLIEGPSLIAEVFPNGPLYVDVAISAVGMTVLIRERTFYAYTVDEASGKTQMVVGYPKALHSRVLFYPDAAFPLVNGSVILLRDDVFATYDLGANEPTILNDKNVAFPGLPAGLRAGIFAADTLPSDGDAANYWMMTADAVTNYSLTKRSGDAPQPLTRFLHCDALLGKTAERRPLSGKQSMMMAAPIEKSDASESMKEM